MFAAAVLMFVAASAFAKCESFYVKVFYVMGKVLSGELFYPCAGLVVKLEENEMNPLTSKHVFAWGRGGLIRITSR